MIISNTYRFAFIHIPKCAGTTVRQPLSKFNEWSDAGPPWRVDHPFLGEIDYGHMPLYTLRDHFSGEFNAVKDYWSFAVVRDPFTRFASSVSQRLNMYGDKPIQRCSLDDIKKAIDESLVFLSKQPRVNHRLPQEYIHFQKQIDYVELDGELIVDSLYQVYDVGTLLEKVSQRVGHPLDQHSELKDTEPRANQSIVFRNDFLRRIFETARPVTNQLGGMLSERFKQRVRDQVYIPQNQRTKDLFSADYLRDFIREYYAEDISLYEKVGRQIRSEQA